MLSTEEAHDLVSEKSEVIDKLHRAKSDGEAQRVSKRLGDIQKTLDADMLERRDYDAAHESAQAIAYGGGATGGHVSAELRALVTPGSPTTDLWVKPPREIVMGTPNQFAQRSDFLTTDTGTIGSAYYFVPVLYKQLVMGLLEASGVLEAQPTMIVTDHLRPIQVPVLTAEASAVAGTEGSPASDTNPTGSKVDLGAIRFDGRFSVSVEMLMASEYNLESLLATFATRAIANKVAGMLALGNGTTEPLGLFTAGAVTVGKTCASATVPTLSEFIQMAKALGKGYRKTARTVVSDAFHTSLVQMLSGDAQYYFDPLEAGGEKFMGKAMYTEPQADQTSMSASEIHAVHGDFSGFFVRTSPVFFRRSDADPLNPIFSFAIWMDSAVADANSLVSLKMGT